MSDTIFLEKEKRNFAFDASLAPALEIDPGATVTFETGDAAYERLSNGEKVEDIGLENFNAVTGPVLVRGAQPGDALKIDVLDVQVRRAWSVWLPEFGALGYKTDQIHVMETKIEGDRVRINETLTVPLQPMIGCIGVAPAEGKGSTFMPAYPFGGNMDLREMSPGATLYLPVQVDGALLSLGDLHAAMGSAEPTWVSLEAAGQVTLRIDVEKNMNITMPRLRVNNTTIVMGMSESWADSHQSAMDQAYAALVDEHGMEPFDAYAYTSARVDMRFGGPAAAIVLAVIPDPD
jgi:amidase